MAWHVGVIGTGQWSRVHLGALSASPHVERITLAGRNRLARGKLAAEFPRVDRTVDDLQQLLADDSVELVHVVLPHHLHVETAHRALLAGKHVICEKPAAIGLEDFDSLVHAADENARRLLVVMNQLYNPLAIRVRELVDEGALGRVFLSVENAYSNSSQNYRDPAAWRTSIDPAGGGMFIDGGYHMVYRHLDGLLRYGPVVAAPSGLALGGGCEVLLHADAIQAHVESYVGLVEAGVGLIPGWGGCTAMLARYAADPRRPRGPMPPVAAAFETIGLAKVAKSAFEARELGFLRAGDGITFNRDRLLADAKARALALAEDYTPPEPAELILPGPSGRASLDFALRDLKAKGLATPHDEVVAGALAGVLTGGPRADMTEPMSEERLHGLEREAVMGLLRTEATLARMEHTLETGKPLRN